MRKPMLAWIALALAWPVAATAQPGGLQSCEDAGVDLTSLAIGDHGEGMRRFYDGRVTVYEVNTEEPAAAPAGIAIVMPAPPTADEPAYTVCWAMIGYGRVDVENARASYDPASGLTLTVQTMRYDTDRNRDVPGAPIRLRINPARGTIVPITGRR